MKRNLFVLATLLLSASFSQAQLVPLGKGVLSTAGKNALQQNIEQAVLARLQQQTAQAVFLESSHTPLYDPSKGSFTFVPKITSETPYDIARLEVAKEVHWDRISLAQQREFARLSQVPLRISQKVSPSLARIYLKDRGDSFVSNGFIVNHNGFNWIALPYHVGGRLLNERLIKIRLKDGTDVSFTGMVGKAGNAGYHAIDISLIRIPDEWQDQVVPLEIAPVQADLPLYSFGSVAVESGHDDFIPVKRTLLKHDGYSLQMTHDMPGDNPADPASISGYCGSPIVQEIAGQLRVVGIFTGHVNPVSADHPSISYAIDASAIPLLIDAFFPKRTIKFLNHEVSPLFFNERLERMALWHNGEFLVVERSLYHFPNEFTPEQAEKAFFDQKLRSGDVVKFTINHNHENLLLEFTIP